MADCLERAGYQISWTHEINPGDTIEIDGGAISMTYKHTLSVGASGTFTNPIQIVSSYEAGHTGKVIINGNYQNGNGINVGNQQYVIIKGQNWQNILVEKFLGDAVVTGPQSSGITSKNLEICENGSASNNTVGLRCGGTTAYTNTFSQLVIHDNALNVDITEVAGGYGEQFNRCLIANYADSGRVYTADGVHVENAGVSGSTWINFSDCIFGPGLNTALVFGQPNAGVNFNDCLFINPATAAVVKTATTAGAAYYSNVMMNKCTSFMTRLNSSGVAHSNLSYIAGQDSILSSIFYGGVVNVTGSPAWAGAGQVYNIQYNTTGNTTYLSASEVNPQFNTNVGGYGNLVSIQKLMNTNFNIAPGSAGYGIGATQTSISQLMSTNQ